MIERRAGVILSIIATTAHLRHPRAGGTGVAFDAIESLRRQWASELGPLGIRVLWLQTTGIPEAFHATGDPAPTYGAAHPMSAEDFEDGHRGQQRGDGGAGALPEQRGLGWMGVVAHEPGAKPGPAGAPVGQLAVEGAGVLLRVSARGDVSSLSGGDVDVFEGLRLGVCRVHRQRRSTHDIDEARHGAVVRHRPATSSPPWAGRL